MAVLGCVVLEGAFVKMTMLVPTEESSWLVAEGFLRVVENNCDRLACTHPSWLKRRGSRRESSGGGGGTEADAIAAKAVASAEAACSKPPWRALARG